MDKSQFGQMSVGLLNHCFPRLVADDVMTVFGGYICGGEILSLVTPLRLLLKDLFLISLTSLSMKK